MWPVFEPMLQMNGFHCLLWRAALCTFFFCFFCFVKIKYTFSCLNHQEPLCKVFFAFGQFTSLAMIAQSQTTLETFDKIRAQKTSMD